MRSFDASWPEFANEAAPKEWFEVGDGSWIVDEASAPTDTLFFYTEQHIKLIGQARRRGRPPGRRNEPAAAEHVAEEEEENQAEIVEPDYVLEKLFKDPNADLVNFLKVHANTLIDSYSRMMPSKDCECESFDCNRCNLQTQMEELFRVAQVYMALRRGPPATRRRTRLMQMSSSSSPPPKRRVLSPSAFNRSGPLIPEHMTPSRGRACTRSIAARLTCNLEEAERGADHDQYSQSSSQRRRRFSSLEEEEGRKKRTVAKTRASRRIVWSNDGAAEYMDTESDDLGSLSTADDVDTDDEEAVENIELSSPEPTASAVNNERREAPVENAMPLALRTRTISDRGDEILNRYLLETVHHWDWSFNDKVKTPTGKGIKNRSNLCFATAALNLLSRVPALLKILHDHRHEQGRRALDCFLCEWKNRFLFPANSTGTVDWFRRIFRQKWRGICNNRQEDSNDAMLYILEEIDENVKKQRPNYKGSPVHEIFGFTLRNEVMCGQCGHIRAHYDSSEILRVQLQISHRKISVQNLLRDYFSAKPLPDYKCTKCERTSRLTRIQAMFLKAPTVLLIHLCRFAYRGIGQKICTPVDPTKEIRLNEFALYNENARFVLCSFIEHIGKTLEGGHYITMAKSCKNDSWQKLDDEFVLNNTVIDKEMQGYLFMYRRKDHV